MSEVRLIDANDLKADLEKYYPASALEGIEPKTLFKQILHDIDNAPTIIPGEPKMIVLATKTMTATEKQEFFDVWNQLDTSKVVVLTDEYGREHFKGICPYTNKKCEKWTCSICEVEKRERRFAEGDND